MESGKEMIIPGNSASKSRWCTPAKEQLRRTRGEGNFRSRRRSNKRSVNGDNVGESVRKVTRERLSSEPHATSEIHRQKISSRSGQRKRSPGRYLNFHSNASQGLVLPAGRTRSHALSRVGINRAVRDEFVGDFNYAAHILHIYICLYKIIQYTYKFISNA